MNKRAQYIYVDEDKNARIQEVRENFSNMYDYIEKKCAGNRETSLALTKLEEAQFWLIKGITRENNSVDFYKEDLDFGDAIKALKQGQKLSRKGWNGKSQYIELATNISYINKEGTQINAEHDTMGKAAIAFVGTSGVQLGWLASQADMLSHDWYIVNDNHIN